MPMGMGAPPPMGGANPQNLQALAAAGDPRAIAILQGMQQGGQGGQGMPPPGAGGAMGAMPPSQGMMPPGGMPGMNGMTPEGRPPGTMSQADFSGYGRPPNADAQARQAAMLIEMLRNRK